MKKLITPQRAERILNDALTLLETTGVEYTDPVSVKKIQEKAPCEYQNGRIRFPKEKIAAFFEARKPELRDSQKRTHDQITIGGQWHSWYLCDPETNLPRPASYQEAVDMAQLAEALGCGRGPIPVAPEKISPRLHTMECERLALLHTRGMGGCLTATDPEEIKTLIQMYEAAGRRYLLALEPMISPLRLNPEVMNIYFDWQDNPNLDFSIFTPIPMAGATAPLVFPAALVQVLAEALALDYIFYHLSDGKQQEAFSLRLDPFDMRDSNIAFGSPEWCLCKQAIVELWNELIGGSFVSGMFRTNSRTVDAQALMERTTSFLWQVELGIRHFSAVGQLSVDEVYSPVQAVIDAELAKYGNRLLKGLDDIWFEEQDSIEIINEGAFGHSFLESDSTADYFRDMFDFSRISDTNNYSTWESSGRPSLERSAWNKAVSIISENRFTLEEDRAREINSLFTRFQNKL